MAKKKEASVEVKLRTLFDLQLIDSEIDKITILRGELPLEVQDLEDDIAGLDTRLSKLDEEAHELDAEVNKHKNTIEEAKSLIKRYEEQQNKVRNNREYDSLTKEIEYQDLEIQLAEKKIKEAQYAISNKNEKIQATKDQLMGKKEDLDRKQTELNEIMGETQKEEQVLNELSEATAAKVEERLLKAYKRIRKNTLNGLAVVPVEREASSGSFIKIPPQLILEIASRKKIIIDEHSGRILVDAELAEEQTVKMGKAIAKALK